MGVTLNITKPPGRDYFTSGDPVFGVIELQSVRASAISSIAIYLEGKLNIAVRPLQNCQNSSFRKSKRVLFSQQRLFTSGCGTPVEPPNPIGECSKRVFSFVMEFPVLIPDSRDHAQDHSLSLSSLPPSISIVCDGLRISVSYSLRVVVNRIGILNKNDRTERNVAFQPLSGSLVCTEHHTALLKTVNYLSTATLGIKGPALRREDNLPVYTPSVQFEVEIPPCRTIFPGDHIHLGLAFVIPDELRHLFSLIWVSGITIRLKITTTGVVSNHKRTCTEYATCYSSFVSMPLYLPKLASRLTIPPELWHHSTYPNLLPSFSFEETQQTHQLEVVVEFAWASRNNIHIAISRNDVAFKSDANLAADDAPSYD